MLGWEFPPLVSGGLGVHCFELSRALADRGVDIDFYMPKTTSAPLSPSKSVNVIPVDFDSFKGRHKFLLPGPYPSFAYRAVAGLAAQPLGENYGMNFFQEVAKYNALAARLVEINHEERRYDAIHFHDWLTAKAGLHAASATSRPAVATIHSTEFDRTANLSPVDWIVDVERLAVRESDAVITVSNIMRNQLAQRFSADSSKLFVVYNGVSHSYFNCRAECHAALGEKVVLFHGRLSIQKGPDFFLKAAKRVLEVMPDAHFVVSGKGGMLQQLVNEAIALGIIRNVTFTGFVDDDELPELYSSADVYVLSSVSEPFGISVLEAMAAGVPAVVSNSAGVGESLKHCLRADFWDVDEMAAKIIAVLEYPPLRRTLSQNAKGEARGFSWSKTAAQTMQVYNYAIAKRGSR